MDVHRRNLLTSLIPSGKLVLLSSLSVFSWELAGVFYGDMFQLFQRQNMTKALSKTLCLHPRTPSRHEFNQQQESAAL